MCPVCGQRSLYLPEGWVEGEPPVCANPGCESNHPSAEPLVGDGELSGPPAR